MAAGVRNSVPCGDVRGACRRVILTRRRGGAEEEAEEQRESQNLRARSQRRSRGCAARRTPQWEGLGERHDEEPTSCGEV